MLRKIGQVWGFLEEKLLEDFVWNHLEANLELIPLKRQFGIAGEYCDILAKTTDNQLVVIELKNCEDRYIVHQLTRYYHGLKTEQPFKDEVDCSQPIRLIAIAPDFHKHNFIDRRYNLLKIEFIRFTILHQSNDFYLHFHLEERKEVTFKESLPFVPSQEGEIAEQVKLEIEPPSKMLINFLDELSPIAKEEILRLREKILRSDRRIREVKDGKNIFYDRGKTKRCCQLKLVPPNKYYNSLQFFLWLPLSPHLVKLNQKSNLGRMSLNCDPDFRNVKQLTYWTPTKRTSQEMPYPIAVYLEQLGMESANSSIDILLDLAIALNLERN